jgi:preprotein translocase subunit YajC
MNLNALNVFLADGAAPAAAQQTTQQQNPTAQLLNFVLLMVGFGAVMYFVMIRPQTKQAKEHAAMMNTLKAGDKVVTTSGVVGVVVTLKEKTITLRSADTKLEVLKSSVAQVTERGDEKSAA